MRRLICAAILGVVLASNAGCLIPMYSGHRPRRAQELIFTGENLRLLLDEWERFWFLDQPNHATPFRVHGGVI